MTTPAPHLLCTASEPISDAVAAAAAALGLPLEVVPDAAACLAHWPDAAGVLVGDDRAAAVAALGPPARRAVFLVGFEAAELARWSVPLGGQVIVLPDGLAAVTGVLADRGASGPVVGVVGGSGGVGASTLAVGLARAGLRAGRSTALVDLDPAGGGLDLLLGAERAPGWRWPDLAGARGEVADLRPFLPQPDGLAVLSMGRGAPGEAAPPPPPPEAVRAVLGSLARRHELVVVDAGRGGADCARAGLALCGARLLLAGSSVRAVAAASAVLAELPGGAPRLAVRPSPGGVAADVVGRALGLPLAGVLPDDRGLARAADDGDLGGRARGRWPRAVARLGDALGVTR